MFDYVNLIYLNMIISVHLPKCAGNSFKRSLEEIYSGNVYFDYENRIDSPRYKFSKIYNNFKKFDYSKFNQTKIIHGHFFADKYLSSFSNSEYITWLRNPVERVISHYFFWKKYPDFEHPICKYVVKNNLSLTEFSRIKYMKNIQSTYLSNTNLEKFKFIGITESYDASFKLFLKIFNHGYYQTYQLNQNKSNYNLDHTPKQVIDNITNNNLKDLKLYDEALKLNCNLLKEFS